MKDITKILAAKKAVVRDWLGRPGVMGMDVGFKYVGGKRTADVAIRLFVRKKMAEIAPGEQFPSLIGEHKTDVIECELKPCTLPDTKYHNPMVGGVQLFSPYNPNVTQGRSGTAGMFVTDNITGQLMILGTFHGDIAPGSPIYQPLNTSQPDETNGQIGFLIRGGHYLTPPVDADVFLFGAPRETNFIIEELGCVKGVRTVGELELFGIGIAFPLGMAVTKRGITTGVTQGSLDGAFFSFQYPPDYQGKVITYDNLLTFAGDPTTQEPLGQAGDSGSVILDSDNNAVALLTLWNAYSATGPSNWGPAFPDILAALNVTPCFCGTILPRSIVLTSSESPALPPGSGMPGYGPPNTGDWSQFVSGSEVLQTPGHPSATVRWTITNVYQTLSLRATVIGFDQPVFRWSINGLPLNQFDADANKTITIKTAVRTDTQIAQGYPIILDQVSLGVVAYHEASYDINGTYSTLLINPNAVQGHIMFTVLVEVCDLISSAVISKQLISRQAIPVTLDTQILTVQPG
jgi:hypothetical protein